MINIDVKALSNPELEELRFELLELLQKVDDMVDFNYGYTDEYEEDDYE